MTRDTIIAAPLQNHLVAGALVTKSPRIDLLPDGADRPRHFKIKTVNGSAHRHGADLLLRHRYAWRGYQTVALPADQTVNRITLSAVEDEVTIGTITVVLDGLETLGAEEAFPDKIAAMRDEGLRLCEFTKLAIDPISGTKRVLAGLFHVAYIIAHRLRGYDALVMEVNPRHVRYYERMLGARVAGEQRMNRKVNAPAVLLSLDFGYVMEQIGEFGGQPSRCGDERSLYPLAFSLGEEAGIIARLMQAQRPASAAMN
jgi:hypothetical protein